MVKEAVLFVNRLGDIAAETGRFPGVHLCAGKVSCCQHVSESLADGAEGAC